MLQIISRVYLKTIAIILNICILANQFTNIFKSLTNPKVREICKFLTFTFFHNHHKTYCQTFSKPCKLYLLPVNYRILKFEIQFLISLYQKTP